MRVLFLAAAIASVLAAQDPWAWRPRTFADGIEPVKVVHVAPSGDDAIGDGTESRPFRTIARGTQGASPGTAVRIHRGTYAAGTFVESLRGRADAPIWIGGAPGEDTPVIEGRGEGVHLSKPAYLVLHDLRIRNTTGNGINVDDGGHRGDPDAARFVVFADLRCFELGGEGNEDGLKLSGVNDYIVVDCHFFRIGGAGSGIDQVGCRRGVIANSQFFDIVANAVQVKGGSEDVEIRSCKMTNAGERAVNLGGSTGADYFRPPLKTGIPGFEARNIRVRDCTIGGSDAAVAFVGCVDCVVSDNAIFRPGRWVLRILQETKTAGGVEFLPASRNRFERNVVTYESRRVRSVVNVGPGTDAASFQFADNVWKAEDDPGAPPPELPSPESRSARPSTRPR
jgi:hypothetical protein